MKKYLIIVVCLSLLAFSSPAKAETKIFIKEYTYQASEDDSRNSSRTIALREVKRLLLEELGTYLESVTEVRNFQLTSDQITTLTAGIVKTEIVDEKWDGRAYWLRARIAADSDGVVKAINTLRQDREKTKELEDVRRRSDELLRENERLRQEMAAAKGERNEKDKAAYDETIKALTATEWFEKGYASTISRNYSDAIDAFSKAIELSPRMANAYLNRGATYSLVGKHSQAIEDFDRVIEINPK
jgi:tetratricopeptide (TPR) repeat protein